ncbi:MAG TPA: hypothetical protein VM686_20585, partial [Polyangiaceae bacterium]|nr:hypothetical protein [Polyangiaceae bacterium]
MESFTNRTFDEIRVGETLTVSHRLSPMEVEALALVSGDLDPFHVVAAAPEANGTHAKSVAGEAFLSGMLCRRLPGPGTTILEQNLHFKGEMGASDELVGTITAREKRDEDHVIVFDCAVRCADRELVGGSVTVSAPTSRVSYTDLATPDILVRRNDAFTRLLQRCERLPPVTCAIVHPCDR